MPFSYKCPNCSANLLFDPDAQKMQCAFCDSKISPNDIVSKDGLEGFMPGEAWDEETDAYVCENCGAQVLAGDDTMATFVCTAVHRLSSAAPSQVVLSRAKSFRLLLARLKHGVCFWIRARKSIYCLAILPMKRASKSLSQSTFLCGYMIMP